MLEAGVEVLLRDGITLGASTFRYADAFELLQEEHGIRVTRGSIHERIWSSQEAWQLDVLTASISKTMAGRRLAVSGAVTERLGEMPMATATDRLNVLAETFRVGSLAFLDSVDVDPSYRLFPVVVAAWKASTNNVPEFDDLGRLLAEVQQIATQDLQQEMTELLSAVQFDGAPQRGMTLKAAIRVFCINATALAYSHTLRCRHDPVLLERFQARCPDGEHRPWNHLGLGLWLIARGLFSDRGDKQAAPAGEVGAQQ